MLEECSFHTAARAVDEPYQPRELVILAAQNLLDAPDLTREITDALTEDLQGYYRQSSLSNESKNYLVARGVRQATSSSLTFVTDMTLMARIASLLENTGQIGKPIRAEAMSYVSKFERLQQGTIHDFMQIMYGRIAMSTIASFMAINHGDLDVYGPLYAIREETYATFWRAKHARDVAADNNQAMPSRGPLQNWFGGISENASLTLQVLAHNDTAYTEAHPNITARQLTNNTLQNIRNLTAPTTVNRSGYGNIVVNARSSRLMKWFAEGGHDKLPSERMIFYSPQGSHPYWTHPTLRSGPWRIPQFCAANIPLRVSDSLDPAIVRRFNEAVLTSTGVDIGFSGELPFTSTEVILALGALVASETIDKVILAPCP